MCNYVHKPRSPCVILGRATLQTYDCQAKYENDVQNVANNGKNAIKSDRRNDTRGFIMQIIVNGWKYNDFIYR